MEDYLLCHAAYLNRLIDAGIDEMSALNRDLKLFFGENGADYPTWRDLEREAAKYLK